MKNADILNALSNKSFAEITPNLKNISPETEIFLEGNSEKNLCKENLQISSKNEEKNENNNEKNNEKNERNRLTEEEKDLLAIYFTITKILFLNGALAVVSKVIEVVEKARAGRELHTTSIRNEHAYYCCIKQLLGFYKPPVKLFTPFYVVGDSHSLPLSFHSFSLQVCFFLLNIFLYFLIFFSIDLFYLLIYFIFYYYFLNFNLIYFNLFDQFIYLFILFIFISFLFILFILLLD